MDSAAPSTSDKAEVVAIEDEGATEASPFAIRFNTKPFSTWEGALSACRSLKRKESSNPKSNWYKTDVVVNRQTSEFQLRCATCKEVFSCNNPANFWRTHKNKCGCSKQGHEYFKGETRSTCTRLFPTTLNVSDSLVSMRLYR